jgi:hypothetical protein
MKTIKLILLLILFSLNFSLIGCEKNVTDRIDGFSNYVSENRIGTTSDVWLEMMGVFGDWDKVVLFFGFMDDYTNCEELKEYNQRKYPKKKFRCVIAN